MYQEIGSNNSLFKGIHMKKILSVFILLALIISSCQKEEEVGGTAVQAMAGEWFVQYSEDNGETYEDNYFSVLTYNTANNSSTEMWIDDHGDFGPFKGKVRVDLSSLTFNTSEPSINEYEDSTFQIEDGKIIKNGTKGPGSNTPTDSIFFKVKFSDYPDDIYYISGYKRTGFLEDEQ